MALAGKRTIETLSAKIMNCFVLSTVLKVDPLCAVQDFQPASSGGDCVAQRNQGGALIYALWRLYAGIKTPVIRVTLKGTIR